MRIQIAAAVMAAVSLSWQPARAQQDGVPSSQQIQTSSAALSTPTTPREKEELQARIYMARKEYAEAANVYMKLSEEEPRNPNYLNAIGIAKQQLSDLKEAGKYYERATKVDKKFATAFSNLGTTWYAQKQYKKAVRYYQRAIALQPQVAGFYTNLGYAYFAQKRYPQALVEFQKAVAIDPGIFQQSDRNGSVMTYQSVADRGLFDFMLAKSYAQKSDAPNCATYLRKALDEGYKEMAKALTDHAFDPVREDPNVKSVLDLVSPPPQKSAASTPQGA